MTDLVQRFLKYVSFETTSSEVSGLHPSNALEFDLLKYIQKEMEDLGFEGIKLTDKGYLYAHISKNEEGFKTIGFIAHVDTSPDASGKDIKTNIIENYDGKDIILNKELNIVTTVKEFPFLESLKGRHLITTDGTTLLGADDKSGVCEIMCALEYLKNHEEIKHGDIYVCFTPDEEIGEGTDNFDFSLFPVDFAYTVDGGVEGDINYENFNAASAIVTINGINIHPGSAKDHMVNSILVAQEFNSMLDKDMVPSKTEKYEGFNHLNNIEGNVEKTTMHYIIRNHSKEIFNKQKQNFLDIASKLNNKYGFEVANVNVQDSYYNMYDIIKDHMEIVNILVEATKEAGVTPLISPIRGGTDGARLTYDGIICPNIGTGGFNFHGRYELISIEGMQKVVEIILNIIKKVK